MKHVTAGRIGQALALIALLSAWFIPATVSGGSTNTGFERAQSLWYFVTTPNVLTSVPAYPGWKFVVDIAALVLLLLETLVLLPSLVLPRRRLHLVAGCVGLVKIAVCIVGAPPWHGPHTWFVGPYLEIAALITMIVVARYSARKAAAVAAAA